MFGPKSSRTRSRSGNRGADNYYPQTAAHTDRGECELCETETVTAQRYTLEVCPACDERYLP